MDQRSPPWKVSKKERQAASIQKAFGRVVGLAVRLCTPGRMLLILYQLLSRNPGAQAKRNTQAIAGNMTMYWIYDRFKAHRACGPDHEGILRWAIKVSGEVEVRKARGGFTLITDPNRFVGRCVPDFKVDREDAMHFISPPLLLPPPLPPPPPPPPCPVK